MLFDSSASGKAGSVSRDPVPGGAEVNRGILAKGGCRARLGARGLRLEGGQMSDTPRTPEDPGVRAVGPLSYGRGCRSGEEYRAGGSISCVRNRDPTCLIHHRAVYGTFMQSPLPLNNLTEIRCVLPGHAVLLM